MTTEPIDLFESISTLPRDVQDILASHDAREDDEPYTVCRELLEDLQPLGFTFEYGLDGEPFDLKEMSTTVQRITFVDSGQDFMEWYVRNGIVIDCQPHQGRHWVGTRVMYPHGPLKAGDAVHYRSSVTGQPLVLNHLVEDSSDLTIDEAERVKVYGVKWAQIKGIPASYLGLVGGEEEG